MSIIGGVDKMQGMMIVWMMFITLSVIYLLVVVITRQLDFCLIPKMKMKKTTL